jgi:nitroreductase
MKRTIACLLALLLSSFVYAQDIELPTPHKTGGMPLMEALAKRSTARAFDSRELSPQQLSDLTWAALGINRPDGKRTSPSARNRQEIDLYVLLKQGVYVYDAAKNTLRQISAEDLRQLGAKTDAPVCLLFVGDLAKRGDTTESGKNGATVDSGFVSQNIYLYCASEGLSTGYRGGGFDHVALDPKLKLRAEQAIVAAQPVGYPKP